MEATKTIRKPAVAGYFYPSDASELKSDIQKYLSKIKETGPMPKALIAPHAGYTYSGPVAATVYGRLRDNKDKIQRVVLFGPSHKVAFYGLAAPTSLYFETPLGKIPIDQESIKTIQNLSQVIVSDEAHAQEHSLEVHLPFLQEILGEFKLVPLVVGDAEPNQVGEVLEKLWGGSETLIVISSDLSHYHDYKTAQKLDKATCQAIENLRPQDLKYDSACGRNPVNGLLYISKTKDLKVETIDLRNSGDTAGSKDQVVGYGSWAFQ